MASLCALVVARPTERPVQVAFRVQPTSIATPEPESPLVFACIAAFLALACITLALYITKSLRSYMLAAWKLLWERHLDRHLLVDAERGSVERHVDDKPDAASDSELDSDDPDEKYQDALDTTPLVRLHDLPLNEYASRPSHVDPPSPAVAMHEGCPSSVSRPAWSVRAIDSPALGLSSRQSNGGENGDDVMSTPDPPTHSHRRAYRSAVPELDVALAMQLRPGLGIGADSAWMVRFLMTIFGWFAVVLTSNGR